MQPTPTDAPLVVGFDLDMTLIDTAPGFGAVLAALGDELGVEFAVEEMTAQLGPPLDLMLAAATSPPTRSPRAVDRFRALYPDHAIALGAAARRRRRGVAAVRRHARPGRGRDRQVRPQRPAARRPPRARPRPPRGRGLGRRQGRRAPPRGRLDLRRRPRPRRRGRPGRRRDQRLGAHRRLHPRGAARRRARTSCSTTSSAFPDWLDEHLLDAPARRPRGRTCASAARCWSPSAGARTARSCSRRPSARSGPDHVVAATGYSHSLPQAERDPAREFAESLGVAGAHPRDPRDGARGLPRQRRRPLLLLQGRAARRAHPAGRRARPGPRRHRHQRRRRGGGVPARHPRGRRARRDHAAPRRRADQGAGPRGLPALGPPDLGQAGRGLPLLTGRVRRRGDAAPAGPGRAGRGGRARRCSRAPAYPCATCGCATSATGRRSRSTPACSRRTWPTAASSPAESSTPSARPASTGRASTPAASGPAR